MRKAEEAEEGLAAAVGSEVAGAAEAVAGAGEALAMEVCLLLVVVVA